MLKSFAAAVSAEWEYMLGEKTLIAVLFVIPILINVFLGLVLSGAQIRHVPMAVVDCDNSTLSRTIVQQFRENEIFDIRYEPDTELELKGLLDASTVKVGMYIPPDFGSDVYTSKAPTIVMLYDGSSLSMTSAAKSRASEILITLKTGILIKVLEGKLNLPHDMAQKMAMDMKVVNRFLYNPSKSYKNFLLPGLGTAVVQSAIALLCASSVRRREVPFSRRKRIGYFSGKVAFYGLFGALSLLLCISVQIFHFNLPFRGSIADLTLLSLLFSLSVAAIGIAISTWVSESLIATVICAVLFVPSTVLVGYTWPVISMPAVYKAFASIHPFYYYADTIRDMMLKGSVSELVSSNTAVFLKIIAASCVAGFFGVLSIRVKGCSEKETVREKIFASFKAFAKATGALLEKAKPSLKISLKTLKEICGDTRNGIIRILKTGKKDSSAGGRK